MSEDNNLVEIEIDAPEVKEDQGTQEAGQKLDDLIKQAKTENKNPENEDKKDFDPKTDWVEFNTPEQKQKFDYMYKQVKNSDTRNAMLLDLLQRQQEQLDSISGRINQEDEADAESIINTKIQRAIDEGDTEAQTKAINELVQFRISKLENQKKDQKVNNTPAFSPHDVKTVEDFAFEKSSSGELKRPWLHETHPDFVNVVQRAQSIAYEIGNPNDPALVYKVMQKLDEEYSSYQRPQPKSSRNPEPMKGSNLTQQTGRNTIKLSRAELDICKKLGVDPKNYYAQKTSG